LFFNGARAREAAAAPGAGMPAARGTTPVRAIASTGETIRGLR
jgi:hypothetical protein